MLGLYGLGLLILPAIFSRVLAMEDRLVPRPDLQRDLHHRRRRDLADLEPCAAPGTGGARRGPVRAGLLSIIGLAVTDAAVKRVDWAASGTWLWLALFALIAATGLVKLLGGSRRAGVAAAA